MLDRNNDVDSLSGQTDALLRRASLMADAARAKVLRSDAVTLNMALASSIARRYINRGVDLEDLHQVALLGLVLAVDRFDPSLGAPFAAFARITISGELKRHLRDHAWAVRPPRSLHDLYLEIKDVTHDLTQTLGQAPSVQQIASRMGVTPAQVREARMAASSYSAVSVQTLVAEQGDAFTGAGLNMATLPGIDQRLTAMAVGQVLQAMPARDRMIVQLRFGQDYTQKQIGQRLGIFQMQVSRLLTSIMARLRVSMSSVLPEAS